MDAHIAWQIGWRQTNACLWRSVAGVTLLMGPLCLIGVAVAAFFFLVGADSVNLEIVLSTGVGWLRILLTLQLLTLVVVLPHALITGVGVGLWLWLAKPTIDVYTIQQRLRWRAFSLGVASGWVMGSLIIVATGHHPLLWLAATAGLALLPGVLALAATDDVIRWYHKHVPVRKRKLALT